jgi:hypothetical protein
MEHKQEIYSILDEVSPWLPLVLSEIVITYTDSSIHLNSKFHQFLVATRTICQKGMEAHDECVEQQEDVGLCIPWFSNVITKDVCGNLFLDEPPLSEGIVLGEWTFTDLDDHWKTDWTPGPLLSPSPSWPLKIGNLFDSVKLSMSYTPPLHNPNLRLGIPSSTKPTKFQAALCQQ